jgi:hypothetical protein
MRIDYFLLSRKLLDRLISSEIHGHGIDREGMYVMWPFLLLVEIVGGSCSHDIPASPHSLASQPTQLKVETNRCNTLRLFFLNQRLRNHLVL